MAFTEDLIESLNGSVHEEVIAGRDGIECSSWLSVEALSVEALSEKRGPVNGSVGKRGGCSPRDWMLRRARRVRPSSVK
jgi:hypothetical protein